LFDDLLFRLQQILFVFLASFEIVLTSLHANFFFLFQVSNLLDETMLIWLIVMVLHQNFPNIFLPKFDFILVLLSELFDILGMPFFQLMSWSEIVFFSSCFVQFVLHLP